MNVAINGLIAPDNYTSASTIDLISEVDHYNIDVVNQAIFWQLKEFQTDPRSGAFTGIEVKMLPGSRTIDRPHTCGIKFRAAIPAAQVPYGSQAIVTIEAVY